MIKKKSNKVCNQFNTAVKTWLIIIIMETEISKVTETMLKVKDVCQNSKEKFKPKQSILRNKNLRMKNGLYGNMVIQISIDKLSILFDIYFFCMVKLVIRYVIMGLPIYLKEKFQKWFL